MGSELATTVSGNTRIRSVNRRVQFQEELYDQLEAGQHLAFFNVCLTVMHDLAEREDMSGSDRDRFSSYKALADQHWKVVDRYLPKQRVADTTDDTAQSQEQGSLDALRRLLSNLIDKTAAVDAVDASTNDVAKGQ